MQNQHTFTPSIPILSNPNPRHHYPLPTTPTATVNMSSREVLGENQVENYKDNEYVSRTGQSSVPVQSDDAKIEDPIDAQQADTDEQLGMS